MNSPLCGGRGWKDKRTIGIGLVIDDPVSEIGGRPATSFHLDEPLANGSPVGYEHLIVLFELAGTQGDQVLEWSRGLVRISGEQSQKQIYSAITGAAGI